MNTKHFLSCLALCSLVLTQSRAQDEMYMMEIQSDTPHYVAFWEGKWGILTMQDGKQKEVTGMIYDNLFWMALVTGEPVFVAQKDNRWGWIDLKGKVITPFEYEFFDYSSDLNIDGYSYLDEGDRLAVCKAGKWGLMDTKGKEVLKCQFEFLRRMSIYDPKKGEMYQRYYVQKDQKVLEISEKGKVLKTLPYKYLLGGQNLMLPLGGDENEWKPTLLVSNDLKKVIFYDVEAQKEARPVQPERHPSIPGELYSVYTEGKYRFFSPSLNRFVGEGYEEIERTYTELFLYRRGEHWGAFWGDKELVSSQKGYEDFQLSGFDGTSASFPGYNMLAGRKGKLWYVIGTSYESVGFEALSFPYGDSTSAIMASKNGKWGCIDKKTGKWLVEPDYDTPILFDLGQPELYLFPVQKNEKWGYVDRNGKLVVPCELDEANSFYTSDTPPVRKDGKKGRVDRNGKITWEN